MGKTVIKCNFNKFYFVERSTFHMSGDRKTSIVRDCLDFDAVTTLYLADIKTPFFAGARLPSTSASHMSIFQRSCRSWANSCSILRNTPCWARCWNPLWHVWYGGYRRGISFHMTPVRKVHNIPFKTFRGSRALRPLWTLGGADDVILGSTLSHCLFIISILVL